MFLRKNIWWRQTLQAHPCIGLSSCHHGGWSLLSCQLHATRGWDEGWTKCCTSPSVGKFGSKLIQTQFETKPNQLKLFGLAIFWLKLNHLVSSLAIWDGFKLGLKPNHLLREPPRVKQGIFDTFYHILTQVPTFWIYICYLVIATPIYWWILHTKYQVKLLRNGQDMTITEENYQQCGLLCISLSSQLFCLNLFLNWSWKAGKSFHIFKSVSIGFGLVWANPGSNRTIWFPVWPKRAQTRPNRTSPTLKSSLRVTSHPQIACWQKWDACFWDWEMAVAGGVEGMEVCHDSSRCLLSPLSRVPCQKLVKCLIRVWDCDGGNVPCNANCKGCERLPIALN